MGRLARPDLLDAGTGSRASASMPGWMPPWPWSGRCHIQAARWAGNAALSRRSYSELLLGARRAQS